MENRFALRQQHSAPSRRVLARSVLVVLVALMALGGGLVDRSPASAQTAGLRVDPPGQSVNFGQSFTVSIVQTADIASLGAQATLRFDPSILQVTAAEAGPVYADALFLFGAGAGGAQTPEQAIAEANTTGALPNIATFFLPGAGSVPPGDAVVATITMTSINGGTSALNLTTFATAGGDAGTLGVLPDPPDGQGTLIPVNVTPGEVTIVGGPPPGGGGGGGGAATPPPAAPESATPATSATPAVLAARADPNAAATVSVAAGRQELAVGGEAKVELKLKANVKTGGAETDISFDNSIIEITKIEAGSGTWKKAEVQLGTATGQKVEQALADANSKGELKAVGAQLLAATGTGSGRAAASPSPAARGSVTPAPSTATPAPSGGTSTPFVDPGAAPSGTATKTPSAGAQTTEEAFLVLTVKGLKNGETELKLKNAKVVDQNDFPVKVTAQNGKLVVGEGGGGGGGFSVLGFIVGLGVIGALGGGGALAYRTWKRRASF